MGVLADTMMRLRGEIGTWRHERVVLQHDLARQVHERRIRVSSLRATFARDRAGAHRAWFGPTLSERRAEDREQQQLAREAKAKVQREHEQQRLDEEAKAKAQRKREQQRRAEEVEARAELEHEQRRLAEQARAKVQREQQTTATAKSLPLGHNPPKPVAAPVAHLAQAQRPALKGSKKH
jgi:hypothetical protein